MWVWPLAAVLAAPLAETVPAELVAWFYAPRAGDALKRVEKSAFAPLLPLFVPNRDRAVLAQDPASELLAAVDRDDGWLILKTGAAAKLLDTWRATLRGHGLRTQARREDGALTLETFGGGGRTLTLFSAPDRLGVTTRATPAHDGDAARSLARSPHFDATGKGADLYGRLDVQALYGALARTRRGPVWAALARRLGLDDARALALSARLKDANTLAARVDMTMPAAASGLMHALGPAIDPVWPADVPDSALAWCRISLRPGRVWQLVALVAAYFWPVEFTLINSQLLGAEAQAGKRLVEDALGDAPAVWTFYSLGQRGDSEGVAVLEVADGLAAAELFGAVLSAVGELLPQPLIERSTVKGRTILEVAVGPSPVLSDERIVFAFEKRRMIVAAGRALLDKHLAQSAQARPVGGAPVVAHGVHDDRGRLKWLAHAPLSGPWRRLKDAMLARGVEPKALAGALAQTTWALAGTSDGWVLDVATTARR